MSEEATNLQRVADPSTYRPASGTIPDEPGVYKWRDEHGRVIYVGKAKSLRGRLNSYFQDLHQLHPRTQQMVTTAASVEWTTVSTEVEALQLEYTWIKEFDPRFNVRYRDDKSYPSLAVTLSEDYPRLQVMRGPARKGVRYFGPYAHAWAIRETLDLLLRVFPARTCSNGVFKRAGQVGRPCLLGYIGKCSAPCVGRVTAEEHREIVDDFVDFMSGSTERFTRRLEREMREAADAQEYERAARLRDDAGALRRAMEKQAVVFGDGTDADELEAAVQVFYVRGGRVRGQRGWVVDRLATSDIGRLADTDPDRTDPLAELVELFLGQTYLSGTAGGEPADVPREILVPVLPADPDVVTELLSMARGSRVDLRVPQRGDKRALMETVTRNAEQAFRLHKLKRASDLTARSRALGELQEALGLADAPLRIECYDVSHVQGTNVVASMVVFEDGLARKSEYRRFALRGAASGETHDDTAWMREVVGRRFSRYLAERLGSSDLEADESGDPGFSPVDPETGRPRKFAYPPQLVVVDGGPPQVAVVASVLGELGIDDVALVGLAKRLEEVWLPGRADPVILPRTSEALYLLQRVRDEAHRFAITYHRAKRSKSMVDSLLDGVPGLGDARKRQLLRHFGSLKRLRAASAEEIASLPGFGGVIAARVVESLAEESRQAEPAVDPMTGEVLAS